MSYSVAIKKPGMSKNSHKSVDEWVRRISEIKLPAFSKTIQDLASFKEDENASAADLARIILQDASLTSTVLRIANSPIYNVSNQEINTISRAVVLLGFDCVRSIGMSAALLDKVTNKKAKSRQMELMASSLFSAFQARAMADKITDDEPEEVFIATLLLQLGEMAFWCMNTKEGRDIEAQVRKGKTRGQAEQEVLGFRFKQLTVALAKKWALGDTMQNALQASRRMSKGRAKNVQLGHDIEVATRTEDTSDEAMKILAEIAEFTDTSEEETQTMFVDAVREVEEMAPVFGIDISARIPKNVKQAVETGDPFEEASPIENGNERAEADYEAESIFPETNHALQLKILSELMTTVYQGADLPLIMEIILEGLFRGVGLDRCVITLLSPDRKQLRIKQSVGIQIEELKENFKVQLDKPSFRLFTYGIKNKRALWADEMETTGLSHLVTEDVTAISDEKDFFVAPIIVKGQAIGMVYADRSPSGRELDSDLFQSFRLFSGSLGMILSQLKG